jgi:hypothetical protein
LAFVPGFSVTKVNITVVTMMAVVMALGGIKVTVLPAYLSIRLIIVNVRDQHTNDIIHQLLHDSCISGISGIDMQSEIGNRMMYVSRIQYHAQDTPTKKREQPIRKEAVVRASLEMCSRADRDKKTVHRLMRKGELASRFCAYCKLTGTTFASGETRKSYYRCDVCGVFLCKDLQRNCFYNFHKNVRKPGDEEEFEILNYTTIL